ncbi:hypothetical protein L3X38_005818 [Prunus dulcis]|uniref:DNA-directed RNA polymerase N-terminal domain-containing protein n=1 Tax=Prunus dulcis TaxID=3755 RepID=A0AAD4ZRR3_PRUDU|nr:hypothetical protein L3X38_005818 [Prunus dulcis]
MEKTARHMVMPYMPMLVPPINWTGYDRGAYLFLPSYRRPSLLTWLTVKMFLYLKNQTQKMRQKSENGKLKLAASRKMRMRRVSTTPHQPRFPRSCLPHAPISNTILVPICAEASWEFSEGRHLGKSGLRWLKIHLGLIYMQGAWTNSPLMIEQHLLRIT